MDWPFQVCQSGTNLSKIGDACLTLREGFSDLEKSLEQKIKAF